MSRNSEIGWTDHTGNPWWGCNKVSPACDNCYADVLSGRLSRSLFGQRVVWGPGGHQEHRMDELERDAQAWNRATVGAGRRHRVFCGSMCDVFEGRDDQRPSLARLWPLIEETRNLNWLLLSKRPNIGRRLLAEAWARIPDNVWVGCTTENQEWADKRIPHLLEIEAAYRFVSVEPQLAHVDISRYLGRGPGKINWVICGGESGVRARGFPEMLGWYRSLRDHCVAAGVPFFFKQWGCFAAEGEAIYRLRGKNPDNVLDGLVWEQHPDVHSDPKPASPSKHALGKRLL